MCIIKKRHLVLIVFVVTGISTSLGFLFGERVLSEYDPMNPKVSEKEEESVTLVHRDIFIPTFIEYLRSSANKDGSIIFHLMDEESIEVEFPNVQSRVHKTVYIMHDKIGGFLYIKYSNDPTNFSYDEIIHRSVVTTDITDEKLAENFVNALMQYEKDIPDDIGDGVSLGENVTITMNEDGTLNIE